MNAASKLIFVSVIFLAGIDANGQIDCSNTGATKLVCLVPYNTRASLQAQPNTAIAATSIFNGPLGSQLSQLPSATSAPGAVILMIHGNPQAYDNLGPVLVDRPDSVGQGRFVLGFSAQQFNFNHLDGIPIGSIQLVYPETNAAQTYQQTVHASVKYNQYVLVGTYGLPQKTDVSVIVPFTRISIGVASISPILYTSLPGSLPTAFPGGYARGFARGPGDVVFNVKHVLWSGGESGRASLAAGFALRLPTGDALNYLGSGAYGYNLYGLAAYKARLSPHVKIGYQWNTNSVLLNVQGTPGQNKPLPGGLQSAVGADFGASRHLTVSADIVTNEFQNSPSIYNTIYSNTVNGAGTKTTQVGALPTVDAINKTFTTVNFSGGLKWKPFVRRGLVLYGNVLIQVNDVGLRSQPSPSGGISYNFRGPDKLPGWLNRSPGHW